MVRPIDLTDNLSKTQAAERMNQIQKAHGEMGQRQVAEALKEKASAELEKAKANEKADMVIIRKEQEKDDSRQKGKKREEKHREPTDDDSQERLDIKG
jgi:hypothetical protein